LREKKLLTSFALIFSFFSTIFILITPLFLGKFYQIITKSNSARGRIFNLLFGEINTIEAFTLLFLFLLIVKFIFGYFQSLFSGILVESFSKYLRELLFKKQLESEMKEFERKEVGTYLLRYSGDLRSISKLFSLGILGFITDMIFVSITLSIFFSMNQVLTLVIIVFFPILFWVTYLINKKLKQISSRQRDIKSTILNFVNKRLSAMLTIKVMNRITIEQIKFEKKSSQQYKNGISYLKWSSLIQNFLPFSLYTMLLVMLLFAYRENQSSNHTVDGAQIIVLIMLTINIIPVLRRILRVNMVWQSGDISLRKYLEIINYNQEKFQDSTSQSITNSNSAIILKSISFSYSVSNTLLDDFSLSINEPGIYYLIGEGGSGKSTFLKLLMGIYEPQLGKIEIFGQDLKHANKSEIRKTIAFASEEATLLGDSIFESVSYNRKDENKHKVVQILEKIGFFKKHDTDNLKRILQKNKGFSKSEEKILILCRAVLMDKKIMLFDEPFKGLTVENKTNFINMLHEMKNEKIIIIAATDLESTLSIKQNINLIR
jgi:ABC-type multidrug transport system fused ATPase/permease subunit